ncbi:hypothetical protein A2U01_0060019, partial [Trifolium medium]|nr:hypothetical protein [Trifolium medium]
FVAKIAEDLEAELEEEELPAQGVESEGKTQHQQADIMNKEVGSEFVNEQIQCFDSQDRASQVDPVKTYRGRARPETRSTWFYR